MSILHTFPDDIPLSSLETYDPSIFRVVESVPALPWSLDDLCVEFDFVTAKTYNKILDRIFDNINYLKGFSKIYNSRLPIDFDICTDYNTDAQGFRVEGDYELTFTANNVSYYTQGLLIKSLDETQFGNFFNIKDVQLYNSKIYVLDDNFLLLLDPNDDFDIKTYFGGFGNDEYLFNKPTKIVVDPLTGNIHILDKGNSRIVTYNQNLSYVSEFQVSGVIDFDYDGNFYILTSSSVVEHDGTTLVNKFNHQQIGVHTIELDGVQSGFLWVVGDTGVVKYTVAGIHLSDYDGEYGQVNDIHRDQTSLYLSTELSGTIRSLDYQSSSTILSSDAECLYTLSSTQFLPEEMNSDMVFNDVLEKIYETLNNLNQNIVGRFVTIFDEQSNVQQVTVEPFDVQPLEFDCKTTQRVDEIISCHSWNRAMCSIYNNILDVFDRVLGIERVDSLNSDDPQDYIPINWTLGAQTCDGQEPQLFNPSFTPISWAELSNPALSCLDLMSEPTNPLIFLADFGKDTDVNHDAVGLAIMARNPDEILHGGDTYNSGDPADVITGYRIFQPYIDQQRFYHIRGNHDDDYETELSDISADMGSTIIDWQSNGWKYQHIPNNGAFPSGWNELGFNDTFWGQNGQAPLGYGETYINTVLNFGPNSSDKYLTQLLRKEFDGNLVTSNGGVLELEFDDGMEIFINGKMVQTWNMVYPVTPSSTAHTAVLNASTGAHVLREYENRITRFDVSKYINLTGTNVIAVMLKQANGTSSDTKFDLRLTNYTFPSVGVFGSYPFEAEGFGDGIFSIAPYMPPKSQNYVRSVGSVDYFCITSGRDTPNSISAGSWRGEFSQSADWLRTAVANSTAPFKFVVTHDTPVTYNNGKYRSFLDFLHLDPTLSDLDGLLHGDVHFTALTEKNNGFIVVDASNFRNSARSDDGLIATDPSSWNTLYKDNTDGNGVFVEITSTNTLCRLEYIDRFGNVQYTHEITS